MLNEPDICAGVFFESPGIWRREDHCWGSVDLRHLMGRYTVAIDLEVEGRYSSESEEVGFLPTEVTRAMGGPRLALKLHA